MLTYNLVFKFPAADLSIGQVGGYIAHPYWPSMDKVVNIQKQSGMNRAKSDANRRSALEQYLKSIKMAPTEYDILVQDSKRPFYTSADGEIIIPPNQFISCIVATCDTARAAMRPCPPDQVRSRFVVTPLKTSKSKSDGVWERFAVVSAGTGQKLSNQRGFRSNEYITDFRAFGSIKFDPSFIKPDVMEQALRYAGEMVGVGASRKMGWGRFELVEFKQV